MLVGLCLQASAAAVNAAINANQLSSVVAADAAAFAGSTATTITAAQATSQAITSGSAHCLDFGKAYSDAIAQVLQNGNVVAAAAAIAAAFAEGCELALATGAWATGAVSIQGCGVVGPALVSELLCSVVSRHTGSSRFPCSCLGAAAAKV